MVGVQKYEFKKHPDREFIQSQTYKNITEIWDLLDACSEILKCKFEAYGFGAEAEKINHITASSQYRLGFKTTPIFFTGESVCLIYKRSAMKLEQASTKEATAELLIKTKGAANISLNREGVLIDSCVSALKDCYGFFRKQLKKEATYVDFLKIHSSTEKFLSLMYTEENEKIKAVVHGIKKDIQKLKMEEEVKRAIFNPSPLETIESGECQNCHKTTKLVTRFSTCNCGVNQCFYCIVNFNKKNDSILCIEDCIRKRRIRLSKMHKG